GALEYRDGPAATTGARTGGELCVIPGAVCLPCVSCRLAQLSRTAAPAPPADPLARRAAGHGAIAGGARNAPPGTGAPGTRAAGGGGRSPVGAAAPASVRASGCGSAGQRLARFRR